MPKQKSIKIKKESSMQKFINVSKEVARFLYIVFLKLLEGRKHEPKALEANPKKKSTNLIGLLRSINNSIRASVIQNYEKFKELDPKNTKAKKTRKTWARVKQDFKEWYAEFVKEFDENQNPELPEKLKEDE